MIINLAYGKTELSIDLSEKYNIDIIEPYWIEGLANQSYAITKALRNPYESKPLREIVSNNRVAIIFSDITRATPYDIIIPAILNEIPDTLRENICFFCANGTHRKVTQAELINILGENIVNNYKIIQNDVNHPELFEYVGTTKSGNDIFLNKEILKYDIKILTGFIEPHFFAGFSGGGKALVPGMAGLKTIRNNHSIANLSHKRATWGITNGNPIWEEIMEAAEFVSGLFLLNIALNKKKEITEVFAGDLRAAHRKGCKFVKDSAMVSVDKLYDIVITSNSGYPLDLNIYQTVKGMSAASQIVKVGGHIIVAAECWDGTPSESDYEKILTSAKTIDELMNYTMKHESTLKDSWQIFLQVLIQKKADVYLYSDHLDAATITNALLHPIDNISTLVNEIAEKTGSKTSICVLPEGPWTIPYLK